MTVEVRQGYKFAVIALPGSRGGAAPAPLLDLPGGYAVSPDLPANALDTWQQHIGLFYRQELEECRLFLWSVAPSTAPEVLDHENAELCKRTLRFFLGTLIGVPYFSVGRPTQLTGANSDGTARVRQMTGFHRTWHTRGAPAPALDAAKLRLAAQLAASLQQLEESPHKPRIERAVRTFREACESNSLDERIHQFVRCAEGIATPWNRGEFADRMSRACAGRCRADLLQLYQIRSAVEHLHGPFHRLPKSVLTARRLQFLQMKTMQAEALARYVLTTILMMPALWPHFRNRKAITAFWKLPPKQFKKLWPTKLAFPAILRAYDPTADSSAL